MRDSSLVGQRLIWVFALGVVLLNDPLFSLFDRGQWVAGFPLVYLYLFGVWIGLIGLMGWTLAGLGRATDEVENQPGSESVNGAANRSHRP